jgi:hypothetical protein
LTGLLQLAMLMMSTRRQTDLQLIFVAWQVVGSRERHTMHVMTVVRTAVMQWGR